MGSDHVKKTARPCAGCAFGPTPDEGTGEVVPTEVARMRALIERGGRESVIVRFTCHRAKFLDNVRIALGYKPRYEAVQCHSASALFDITDATTPVEPIDREFDRLVERKCAQGPEPKS